MTAARLRPIECGVFISPCRARLPFRFGIHTMTGAPLASCRIEVEFEDGRRGAGYASDLLVPKWFEKDPAAPIAKDWGDLIASQQAAIAVLLGGGRAGLDTAFGHWLRVYAARVGSASRGASDLLVRGEGVSLVERAMIDAVCRRAGMGLHGALRAGLLGFEGAALDASLAPWRPSERLGEPPRRVALRHTVGLVDAILARDLTTATRVNDGLPESLDEDIRAFGLTHFKIKVSGDAPEQVERLAGIWKCIRGGVGPSARVTLDGNEQFESVAQLADLVDRLERDARFEGLTEALLLIEQPLSRARTFDRAANRGMDRLARHAPCIIDEADVGLDSLPEAAALGYGGVSVKNCKGVFRALANRARCDLSGGRLFQSAEDLTNLPLVALQQDLATVAALGITHVERNGHHYFRGLDHLPGPERSWALARHPDLYVGDASHAWLRIERGELALGSLLAAPGFGYAGPVGIASRIPAEQWDPGTLC